MVSWLSLPLSDSGPVNGRSKPTLSGAPGAAAFAAAEPDATALGGAFAAAEPDAETALAAGRALAEIAADGAVDGAEPAPPQAASMAGSTATKAKCFGF